MGAAGWHICFDVLEQLLAGQPIGRIVGVEAMKLGGWQRLNAEYANSSASRRPLDAQRREALKEGRASIQGNYSHEDADQNSRHEDPMNPSERIDQLIAGLTDWRGKTFARVRKSILEADREIIEEWKWMGSPVWSRDGIIAVANAHKDKVKLTFSYGASLPDPDKLFNAGLEGNA